MSDAFPDEVIDAIAKALLSGMRTNDIAAKFKVNRMTVWRVRSGEHANLSAMRRRELKKAALTPQVRTAQLVKQNKTLSARLAALRVRLDKLKDLS